MPIFLLILAVGAAGLLGMALPGLFGHAGHLGHGAHAHAHALRLHGRARFVPEPRALLSFLALFGAFGNLTHAVTGWGFWACAGLAAPVALALELAAVRPLWRLAARFQGRPASPLSALVLEEARAVTGFRNGRGLVSVLRDGRQVQLSARLADAHPDLEVRVGDRLRVLDVDVERERVTVGPL